MLPAWYLRGTYFSDKWHNCHEKFAPKKAKKKTSKTKAAMPRKCREKKTAAKKRQCRERICGNTKAAMQRKHAALKNTKKR